MNLISSNIGGLKTLVSSMMDSFAFIVKRSECLFTYSEDTESNSIDTHLKIEMIDN